MARDYTIAYIVGLQHCGSTLFDLLLNAHSQAVTAGEIFALPDYANGRRAKTPETPHGGSCTCGADSIWDCTFWTALDGEVQRRAGITLRDIEIDSSDPDVFAAHNALFFDSLAAVTGARLIVDSSKRLRRLTALLRHATLPVVPIHLLRNPNGQIYSMIKRGKTAVVEPAGHYRRTTLSTLRLLRGRDHVSLRYEALVKDPEAALQRVMPLLGLDYEPSQLDWAAAERHNLGGNRMRRTASSDIVVRDEWRDKIGLPRRALIDLLTLPATYGTRHY